MHVGLYHLALGEVKGPMLPCPLNPRRMPAQEWLRAILRHAPYMVPTRVMLPLRTCWLHHFCFSLLHLASCQPPTRHDPIPSCCRAWTRST